MLPPHIWESVDVESQSTVKDERETNNTNTKKLSAREEEIKSQRRRD